MSRVQRSRNWSFLYRFPKKPEELLAGTELLLGKRILRCQWELNTSKGFEEGDALMVFVCYPKCTTCQKAKKWLQANGIEFEERHIKEDNPTVDEIRAWHKQSGLPLRKLFNTSGMLYRDLQLKDRLPEMTEDEQYNLLASDGMLVKRPILVGDQFVLVGFNEPQWKEALEVK